jgi:hypothetical protein
MMDKKEIRVTPHTTTTPYLRKPSCAIISRSYMLLVTRGVGAQAIKG